MLFGYFESKSFPEQFLNTKKMNSAQQNLTKPYPRGGFGFVKINDTFLLIGILGII